MKQANDFLAKTNTTMTAQYLGHWPRLGEWSTSQWQITFSRQGRKPFTLTFSQSLNSSWKYHQEGTSIFKHLQGIPPKLRNEFYPKGSEAYTTPAGQYTLTPVKRPPSAYDVLACLTKYDPGTFKDFCADFGYSDDSIKALETYRAVQEEWQEVNRMFGDCLDELGEIN